ncbi:subtilisin-like protein, partial [Ceratobasidium sp. AG-I]
GIFTEHSCFNGRARWGANFTEDGDHDANGHGTHTAGIAVGDVFGQATSANVIAVKVLGDTGNGSTAGIIAGIDWALREFMVSGRPSIANISFGGSPNFPLDTAVRNAIQAGLSFTVDVGTENRDAKQHSPARAREANTVGVVDGSNHKASFSNYGSAVKVWAPGVEILSAWIGSPNAVKRLSGSSMATPVVAGYMAVVLGRGPLTPQSLTEELVKNSKPVVTGAPPGTTNLLAQPW